MEKPSKHIIIIAGETSGDMHAAQLVKALKNLDPHLTFSGLGGPRMRQSGVALYEDLTQLAVVGFWEVLKHYKRFKKIFEKILIRIRNIKPAAVILVDYPGFNLRLAKQIKAQKNLATQVIYYISPQVWAWKKKRVFEIKKHVDQMLVLFPFEKDFYARYGVEADYVGHPLLDEVVVNTPKDKFLQGLDLADYKLTLALLPGSRQKEVETLLPIMLEAVNILRREFPMMQFLIIKAPNIERHCVERLITTPSLFMRIIEKDPYDAINASDLCLVASGTATLETAILQKPMVIIYKTSLFTWLLARLFIKIPDIGLVNIVAGKRIVPECLQFDARPDLIAQELKNIFTHEEKSSQIKHALREVRNSLGKGGASQRAAKKILEMLAQR